jgi:hypothetical protein
LADTTFVGSVQVEFGSCSGNHEYKTPEAAGYFDYFDGVGALTGPAGDRDEGYYSYDVRTWHLIALNASCGVN